MELDEAIGRLPLAGVSTRRLESLAEELFGSGLSRSQVSEITKRLDAEVASFRGRKIPDTVRHLLLDGISTKVMTVHGVEFAVQRSESAGGPCVDVVATVEGIAQGGVGGGPSGDCDRPQNPDLGWGLGGLLVGDEWFNIAYGAASPAVATVSVALGDGTEVVDDVAGAGVWLVVVPADPLDALSDFSHIRALDATGRVIVEAKPPSLVAFRRLARQVAGSPPMTDG